MTSRDKKIVVGIATAVVMGVVFVTSQLTRRHRPTREIWETVRRGMPESAVRALLGSPSQEYSNADAPAGHYFAGCGHMKHNISGNVLIYLETDLILYVYFDTSRRVEKTVIASI